MRQRQCAIVLAAIVFASTASGQSPKRITWTGTMIDADGNVMALRVKTRVRSHLYGDDYEGRLSCRGAGCRFNRASFVAVPITELQPYDYIDQVQFQGELGQAEENCYALALPREGRPDFGIDGTLVCYLRPRHGNGASNYIRDGAISLRQSVD